MPSDTPVRTLHLAPVHTAYGRQPTHKHLIALDSVGLGWVEMGWVGMVEMGWDGLGRVV